MLLNAFIVALIVALVMTAIFVWGFKVRGVGDNGLAFFFIVFLATWAAGIWVRPLNYAVPQNVPWVPQLIVGFLSSLLMSWSVPSWRRAPAEAAAVQSERRAPPVAQLTPAYWVALVALIIAIIVR